MFNSEFDVERADAIEARIEDEAERVARHPYRGRPTGENARRWLIHDLRYIIGYRVDDVEDRVRIESVWHTREDRGTG